MAITPYEFSTDQRSVNVIDRFVNMESHQVKEAIESGRSELVNICMNLASDFNKSSIVRSSNAFLAREVFFVGARRFDRRGTQGSHHYENVLHADTLQEVVEQLRSECYTIFAVDNTPEFNPEAIYDVELPAKTAFVYGEEQRGLSVEEVALCDKTVFIPQRGVIRSLNVASAATVMMSEYTRRHVYKA